MNIQPLNGNTLGSSTLTRHQDAVLEAPGTAAQQVTVAVASQPAEASTEHSGATTSEQLADAVKATNDFVNLVNNSLTFSVDEDSGKTIVKVVDKDTKELIRQIPSEEMLAIARALDKIKGLLVHQKA